MKLLVCISKWLSAQKDLSGFDVSYHNDIHSRVVVAMIVGARFAKGEFSLTAVALEGWTEADVSRFLDATRSMVPPARSFRDGNV